VRRVILLVRGKALGGQPAYRERVLAERKIEVRYGAEVAEIVGEAAVSGARLVSGERLGAQAVFTYIGLAPNTGFLRDFMPLDAAGRIATDASLATVKAGIFAAGLARAGSPGRAIASAGEGAAAAFAANEYLLGKGQ
jgi:thioredoxin reductase